MGWNEAANEIFLQAIEHESSESRRAYLQVACGTDRDLRAEVESLLEACQHIDEFLETPPSADVAAIGQCLVEGPGTLIGPYKLLELIGEGGMGVVFMAEQREPVRRKVALKIIKPGLDTRQVIARFEAERQALAVMDHPNIAHVLDAGATESGRPYFVMELIFGIRLTEYCDQNQLTTRERLELFIPICHAVQHAHRKGIIHRDIKPSNILVTLADGVPIPKIIDFGIAKATNWQLTEKTVFTGYGQVLGTPQYMSPEQAEMSALDVDIRSDVYSLGVLLYELMTGSTPFDKQSLRAAGLDEIRRIIREEEPLRPSLRVNTLGGEEASTVSSRRSTGPDRLRIALRGELDWIIMKALEKDRNRRYETADGFAQDIQRYLRDDPVEACPPSAIYRTGKFARRHKLGILTVSAIFLSLAIGAGVAAWQASQAAHDREIAEQNFQLAVAVVDQYLTRVSEEELFDTPSMQPLREDLLKLALDYYQQFVARRHDDPELQAELAAAHHRVGLITDQIGSQDRAIESFVESVRIYEKLVAEDPKNPLYQAGLGGAYTSLGTIYRDTGRRDEALEYLEKACAIREVMLETDTDTFSYQVDLAQTLNSMGIVHHLVGDLDRAGEAYRKSIAILSEAMKHPDALPEDREILVGYQLNLARFHVEQGDSDAARPLYENGVASLRTLVAEKPSSLTFQHSLGLALNNFGWMESRSGQSESANELLNESMAIRRRLVEENPAVAEYRSDLGASITNLVQIQMKAEEYAAAESGLQEAVAIFERLAADHPTVVGHRKMLFGSYSNLSILQRRTGQTGQGLDSCRRAIEIGEQLVGEHPSLGDVTNWLANAYSSLGPLLFEAEEFDEAKAALERALEIRRELVAREPHVAAYQKKVAAGYFNLGFFHQQRDESVLAIEAFGEQVAILEQLVKEHPSNKAFESELSEARHNYEQAAQMK